MPSFGSSGTGLVSDSVAGGGGGLPPPPRDGGGSPRDGGAFGGSLTTGRCFTGGGGLKLMVRPAITVSRLPKSNSSPGNVVVRRALLFGWYATCAPITTDSP